MPSIHKQQFVAFPGLEINSNIEPKAKINSAGVGATPSGQVMKSNHIKIMQNTNGERN